MSLDPHFERSARGGYYHSLSFRIAVKTEDGFELQKYVGPQEHTDAVWRSLGYFTTKKAARAYAGRVERGEVS